MSIVLRQKNNTNKPLSISEYINELNSDLSRLGARIIGEVTSFKIWSSGHAYFSLKDKKDNSVINCMMWQSAYKMCGLKLEDGMEIIASGSPEIWAPSGKLSFITSIIELSGEGSLKKAYEELKRKLEVEGLFAEKRKRKLPDYPQNIGVITSAQGAVISDFLTNIGKHGFNIKLIHSSVEGQQALPDLLYAIKQFRDEDIDVLVIIRGGGSLESLQAFNSEALVREVVFFPVPVMVGIGHEKDISLVAFAADFMGSTPTAIANKLDEIWKYYKIDLMTYEQNTLNKFERLLGITIDDLKSFKKLIVDRFKAVIGYWDNKLNYFEKMIVASDPSRQFKIGFSVVRLNGKIVKNIAGIFRQDIIETQVSNGVIKSKVEIIFKNEKN